MRQPSVLMFAYPFPPAAAAGTFRTLRFVRYLPEYGWNALVLTALPECLHHKKIDPGLNKWIPPGILVERTTVLRPFTRMYQALSTFMPRQERRATHADTPCILMANSDALRNAFSLRQ